MTSLSNTSFARRLVAKGMMAGALLAAAVSLPARASVDVSGYKFEDTAKVAGKDLKLNGAGMRRDTPNGIAWLRVAAKGGHAEAKRWLDLVGSLTVPRAPHCRATFTTSPGRALKPPPEFVELVEDPTNRDAPGATPFDSEGAPTRRVDLITDGVLRAFLHNVTSARRGGTVTTGSASGGGVGPRATSLRPGTRDQAEIIASLPRAFYVQAVSGLHSGTSTVSGDFSVGAVGLMVRDGEFAEPVREATIASTLPRMLLDLTEIGADRDWMGAGGGMTLVIGEMTLSGS